MTDENFRFADYANGTALLEKKKKKKSKKKKKRGRGLADSWFTDGAPSGSSGTGIAVGTGGMGGAGGSGGGVGESLITELFAGITPAAFSANMNSATAYSQNDYAGEESGLSTLPPEDQPSEEELEVNAIDSARQIFQRMKNEPNITRAEILNAFMDDVGVTESTATSYYTRFLKEFGMTSDDIGSGDAALGGSGMGGDDDDEMAAGEQTPYGEPDAMEDDEMENPEDPNRAGVIRTIDNAHLIYKKQSENGTYEELWIYNINANTNDELKIRREVLAGTDIPPQKTRSPDGVQTFTSTTMGNAQMLEIKGLPN